MDMPRYTLSSQPLPLTGFVRLPVILQHYPVSASTWWTMVREGRAPKAIKLGPNTTAWNADEIREFLGRAAQGSVS